MFQCFSAEPCFDDSEAFNAYPFLHLSKVGFSGCFVLVPAYVTEVSVSSEAFYQVFDIRYLFELSDHESPKIPRWVVRYWSAWAFCVEVFPEDRLERG